MKYTVEQEVLLFNMQKQWRKGGRIEPDFSGPYTVEINGKRVSLANAEGTLLKTKYSADHIKPYKRTQKMMDTIPNERPHLEEAKPTSH